MSLHCVEECSGFLTTHIINAKIYKHGTVNMSIFLNPPLPDLIGPRTSMFLILFCIKNILRMVVYEPPKIIP